jgi:hypothetical protein
MIYTGDALLDFSDKTLKVQEHDAANKILY